MSATPTGFREQMTYLRKRFCPVDLELVLDALLRGATLPPRAVHVTFDDAYRDFGEVAWPILRELDIPVTVFVPTAYPSDPAREFWWDRLHKAATRLGSINGDRTADRNLRDRLRFLPHDETERAVAEACRAAGLTLDAPLVSSAVLNWEELRELGRQGVDFGAHTRCHVALTRVDEQRARDEIRGSLADVKEKLGFRAPTFAYPYGMNNASVRRVAHEEGCALAFTCDDGLNDPGHTDLMAVRRTNITLRTTSALFALRMQPWFAELDRWRHRGQRAKITTP